MRASEAQWKEFVSKFTYKPGWDFQIATVPGCCDLILRIFAMVHSHEKPTSLRCSYLLTFNAVVPEFPFKPEVAAEWIQLQIQRLELHEMDEWLKFGGKHVRNPHPHIGRPSRI